MAKKKQAKLTGEAFKKKMAEAKAKRAKAIKPAPEVIGVRKDYKVDKTFFMTDKGIHSIDSKGKIENITKKHKSKTTEKIDTPQPSVENIDKPKRFGGRPPIFESVEQLQDKIEEYFAKGMAMRKVLVGPPNNKRIELLPVPTITGLCFFLGFESRQSFYDYEERPAFSYTIKKARLFIEKEYEELLQTTGSSAIIFALKNMGWKDESSLKVTDETDAAKRIAAARHKFKKSTQPSNETSS